MNLQVRTMRIEDAPGVQVLSAQLGYPLALADIENNIKELMNSGGDNCLFVALADEKIVGWIHGFRAVRIESRPFVEIGGLVVNKEFRGKGVGRRLVEKVKEWCLQKNFAELRVRSQVKRSDAHRFYTALGFIQEKEQKVFKIQL